MSQNARSWVVKPLLTACALGLCMLVVLVPKAGASAEGCTAAPLGYVCNYTHGTSTWVSEVDAIRGKLSWDAICSYSAKVFFYIPHRGTRVRRSGIVHNGACSFGRAWINFAINRHYRDGTKICVAFYEYHRQQGGRPCEYVEK